MTPVQHGTDATSRVVRDATGDIMTLSQVTARSSSVATGWSDHRQDLSAPQLREYPMDGTDLRDQTAGHGAIRMSST